ncbi:uncharacterized protein LOC117316748 isoform X2 [Pecten maximus]|uniref:uncharacterized protein LOC117316748 isoform X2 n=1 Tax=Pecten maximus TaxID=6579 RepID=UPI001458F3CA|nr:uncharacterized protein LOC117316748 isoform X2 [Pecten maximus]
MCMYHHSSPFNKLLHIQVCVCTIIPHHTTNSTIYRYVYVPSYLTFQQTPPYTGKCIYHHTSPSNKLHHIQVCVCTIIPHLPTNPSIYRYVYVPSYLTFQQTPPYTGMCMYHHTSPYNKLLHIQVCVCTVIRHLPTNSSIYRYVYVPSYLTLQQTPLYTGMCMYHHTSPSNKLHHIQGRKHLRNIQSHSTPETAPVKNATCFRCMFCNISVNSLDQLEIHRQGSKHRAILQKMKEQQQGGVVDDRSVVVATQKITN